MTLTRSKVNVKVTGLLNFRQLAKPCMLAAMTAAPLRGFLVSTFAQTMHCSQVEIYVQQMTSDFNDVTHCVHFEGRISHASSSLSSSWKNMIKGHVANPKLPVNQLVLFFI